MPKTTEVRETTGSASPAGEGRIQVQLISPGWGSSGHYSQKVLENAGRDKVWPAGTHIFFDHPSETESYDRPERSVRDLAGILAEDAHWDLTVGALVAEARVMGPYRELVTDPVFVEAVGMSIRAGAETTAGEADGRKGLIVTRLVEGMSVDLVTRAGRGGKVLAVLESARAQAFEAMTRETRDLLDFAVGDQAYVVDFDPDAMTVVYRVEHVIDGSDDTDLMQDGYTLDGDRAVLTGSPIEVRQTVSYVPAPAEPGEVDESGTPQNVPAPAGRTRIHPPTSTGGHMGTNQVDEAEFGRLTEAAGRVKEAEAKATAAEARASGAERELAVYKAREAVRPLVAAKVAESGLPARRQAKIVEAVLTGAQLDDHGRIDATAVVSATEAEVLDAQTDIAELAEALGAGTVRGFGRTTAPDTEQVTEADAARAVAAAFGRTVKEV